VTVRVPLFVNVGDRLRVDRLRGAVVALGYRGDGACCVM